MRAGGPTYVASTCAARSICPGVRPGCSALTREFSKTGSGTECDREPSGALGEPEKLARKARRSPMSSLSARIFSSVSRSVQVLATLLTSTRAMGPTTRARWLSTNVSVAGSHPGGQPVLPDGEPALAADDRLASRGPWPGPEDRMTVASDT